MKAALRHEALARTGGATAAAAAPAAPEMRLAAAADGSRAGGRRLRHIPELDGLRGIAALMVFCHHAAVSTVHVGPYPVWVQRMQWVCSFGNSGVDIFFVLSGFLITSILLGDRRKREYYAPFYWKRVLRIVPVYMLVLLYIVLTQPHNNVSVLCAMFFVANLSLLAHIPPVAPFWSLAIEEQFYLLWPSLVHRKSVRSLQWWAAGIAVGTVLLRFGFAFRGHFDYFLTFLHCDGLALGALLACLYVRREERGGSAWPVVLGAWAAGVASVLLSFALPEHTMRQTAMVAATSLTGVTLVSLGLVGTLVFATGSRVLGVFRSRVLVYFGLISYCFYLVHLYVLQAYDRHWPLTDATDVRAYFVRLGLVLAGAVAVSTASRYAVELPVQRLRRFIPVLQTPAARAEAARVSA